MTDYPDDHPLAGPLGQVIAAGIQAHADHHEFDRKEERNAHRVEFLKFLEGEGVASIQEMLGPLLRDLQPDGHAQQILDAIQSPDHPIQLAAIIPVLVAVGYQLGSAALSGPASRLQTLSMRNFGDVKPDAMFAADALARIRIDRGLAEAWKDDNGFTEVDLDDLVRSARPALPPGVLLELWRRGKIGAGDFVKGMSENGYGDTDIANYQDLFWQEPSYLQAINAATQNQLDHDRVRDIMAKNGIDPENFEWMYQTNGAPLSVEMANKLYNYGLLDKALYDQALLESPLKNKYVPALEASRFHRPPMRVTLSMVRNGVIDKAKAMEYMNFLGFFPEDAEVMVDDALKAKTAGVKELSAANLRGMYAEGLIDRGTAESRIVALGFDQADATMMIDYADAVRKRQRVNRAITHIRSLFVSHKIDEPAAIGALDQLQIPTVHRDELIHDWEIEHAITTKHLTLTDLAKGFHANIFTENEVYSRLIAAGYAESDAHAWMTIHNIPAATNAKLRDLTQSQLLKMMAHERIPEAVAKTRLMGQGLEPADAQLLIDDKLERNPDGSTPTPPAGEGTP